MCAVSIKKKRKEKKEKKKTKTKKRKEKKTFCYVEIIPDNSTRACNIELSITAKELKVRLSSETAFIWNQPWSVSY